MSLESVECEEFYADKRMFTIIVKAVSCHLLFFNMHRDLSKYEGSQVGERRGFLCENKRKCSKNMLRKSINLITTCIVWLSESNNYFERTEREWKAGTKEESSLLS